MRRSRGLAIASTASQGLVAVATLLAARACDPALFGVLGVFTTIAVIGGTIASLRMEAAITLPRRDRDARRLAFIGLVAAPVAAALGGLAVWLAGPRFLPVFDASGIAALPWAVPAGILVLGVRSILLGWCTRRGFLRAMANARLANGVAMSLGLVAAATVAPDLAMLVIAWLAGQAAEAAVLGLRILRDPSFRPGPGRPGRRRRLWRRYRRFPGVQMWAHLLDQLGPHLPTALIAAAYSAEVAGLYSLVARIVARPLAVIGTSVAVVVQHEASLDRRARRTLRPLLVTALRRLAIAAMVVFIPIAAIGPWLLPGVLGEEWKATGTVLLAILPGVVADFITIPLLPVLGVIERLGTQLLGGIARLVLTAAIVGALGLAEASPIAMMAALGGVVVAMDVMLLVAAWRGTVGTEVSSRPKSPPTESG